MQNNCFLNKYQVASKCIAIQCYLEYLRITLDKVLCLTLLIIWVTKCRRALIYSTILIFWKLNLIVKTTIRFIKSLYIFKNMKIRSFFMKVVSSTAHELSFDRVVFLASGTWKQKIIMFPGLPRLNNIIWPSRLSISPSLKDTFSKHSLDLLTRGRGSSDIPTGASYSGSRWPLEWQGWWANMLSLYANIPWTSKVAKFVSLTLSFNIVIKRSKLGWITNGFLK